MIRWIALVIGVACLVAAVWINAAYQVSVEVLILTSSTEQGISLPNWLPTGTSFGLSIAGGLCILGACVADSKTTNRR